MPSHVVQIVREELSGIPTLVVTVLRIAYKGDVDDIRESSSLEVVNQLLEAGYVVRIFDPHVREVPRLPGCLFTLARDKAICMEYPMLSVVLDAGPLITACKLETLGKLVIDHLLAGCRVVIAPEVEEEVAVLGAGYPNGVAAGERVARGSIQVVPLTGPRWGQHLAHYALGDGERFHRAVWASRKG